MTAAVAIIASAQAGIEISVTHGRASDNVLSRANCDFESGLKGWSNRHSNEVFCVESHGRGKVFCCDVGDSRSRTVSRYVKVNPDWKGRTFILSCDIKPSKEVSSRELPDSSSGLGCKLTVWNADWKKSMSVGCMAEGPDKWFRVSSKPFVLPDWTAYMSIAAGIEYSKGSGLVDNIALEEATAAMNVTVNSDASIRQVKVFGEDGSAIFDTGLIDGGRCWTHRIPTGTSQRCKVYAVDSHGGVAVAEHDDGGSIVIPERHKPIVTMGRDFWRVLSKYSAYGCDAKPTVGMDNAELNKSPALSDVAYVYIASAKAPTPESGLAVWPRLGDYFKKGEPDAEILISNPEPDRPFFLTIWSERAGKWTWGRPVKLDMDEYRKWRTAHPNMMIDGYCGEWSNDLLSAIYPAIDAKRPGFEPIAALFGGRPKSRYEQLDHLERYYKMRKERYHGGKMGILDAGLCTYHAAADFGASFLFMETTATGLFRHQVMAMFTRGAARQFGIPWEWYVANYADGPWTNGVFLVDCCGRYPNSAEAYAKYPRYNRVAPAPKWRGLKPQEGFPTGKIVYGYQGLEFGISRSLFRREHYLSYLCGANFTQLEEWMTILKMWNREKNKTVFSPRGRIYAEFADFARKHLDRGAHFSPVAICVPLAQGYPAAGGRPWNNWTHFGPNDDDRVVDAVFFTLVPGCPYSERLDLGEEVYLRNSPYADMYDVIAPDAKSQTPDQMLDVMKSYKALVVVGEYADHGWEKTLAKYEANGGKVVKLTPEMLKDEVKIGKGRGISKGEAHYPKMEAVFNSLQEELFPFKVEGNCMYGLSVADDHVWLYVLNNDGVTKFVYLPERLDDAKASEIRVTPRSSAPRFGKVTELISGKTVLADDGAFSWRVGPGGIAVFEMMTERGGAR